MSVEIGSSDFQFCKTNSKAKVTGVHESLQQESERDALWFRDVFLGKRKFLIFFIL
jgi:RAP1 GTPase activating protein 1